MQLFSRKLLTHTGWLLADRCVQLGAGGLLGILIARTLGPESFGLFSYTKAFVTIFYIFCSLNLYNVIVRDLVQDRQGAPITLASFFGTFLFLGLINPLICLSIIQLAGFEDYRVLVLASIFALIMPLKTSLVFVYWFEAQTQGRFIFFGTVPVFLLSVSLQAWLLFTQPSAIGLVLIRFMEAAACLLLLMLFFVQKGPAVNFSHFRFSRAKALIREGLPLAVSLAGMLLAWRIDQIMVGRILGAEAVGHYAISASVLNLFYPAVNAVIASVYPSLVEALSQAARIFHLKYQRLLDLVVIISAAVALPLSLLSDMIIAIIFGPSYSPSAEILTVYIWVLVFASLGLVTSRWLIAQGRTHLVLYRSLAGVLTNTALNLLLIPLLGMIGAAWATLISLSVTYYFMDLTSQHTRGLFVQKTKALTFFWLWSGLLHASKTAEKP